MIPIRIVMDNAEEFNEAVHGAAPDTGDLALISKSKGTTSGSPVVAISFTAVIGGEERKVQTVTTLKLLKSAVDALVIRHGAE